MYTSHLPHTTRRNRNVFKMIVGTSWDSFTSYIFGTEDIKIDSRRWFINSCQYIDTLPRTHKSKGKYKQLNKVHLHNVENPFRHFSYSFLIVPYLQFIFLVTRSKSFSTCLCYSNVFLYLLQRPLVSIFSGCVVNHDIPFSLQMIRQTELLDKWMHPRKIRIAKV